MKENSLKFPVGKFDPSQELKKKNHKQWIKTVRKFPKRLEMVVAKLNDQQLDTPYRPGGWTVRQLVHHVADSHVNSYVRFRWTMTEETPVIKAYYQERWAELPDATTEPVEVSIQILKGIHKRWVALLKAMTKDDFKKELSHPEWKNNLTLSRMLSLYAWHCDHHLAHITSLIGRKGW